MKKTLSIILCLVMILSVLTVLPFDFSAASTSLTVIADGVSYAVKKGDIVTYTYYLSVPELVHSIDYLTVYQTTGLELQSDIDDGSTFPVLGDSVFASEAPAGTIRYNYSSAKKGKDFTTESSALISLDFLVTAASGEFTIDTTPLVVAGPEEHKFIFDGEIIEPSIKCRSALINKNEIEDKEYIRGDYDDNGSVNIMDATRVQNILAKLMPNPGEAFLNAVDATGDTSFNIMDATRIQNYLAKIKNMDGTDYSDKPIVIDKDVESITLAPMTLSLTTGQEQALTVTVLPADATYQKLTWSSSDASVATVDQNGKVTALAVGSVTITAASMDGSGVKSTCTVTVKAAEVKVESIVLTSTSTSLTVGQKQTLTATVSPSDATDKKITWSSSDSRVAIVDKSGNVTASSYGEADITAQSTNGKTAVCHISVSLATPKITKAESTASGVKLTWNSVGAPNYCVFQKSGNGWTRIGYTASNSFTHTAAKNGTTYTYTVRCVTPDTTTFISDFDPSGKTITYNEVLLATPQITKLENKTDGIHLTWNAVSGAEQYRIYTHDGTTWQRLADTDKNTYTVTGVYSGSSYRFTLRCLTADGKKFTSGFDKTGWNITYIATPKIQSYTNKTGITVNWNAVKGAAKYRVFVKGTNSGDTWKTLGDTTSTSYTHRDVYKGEYYSYTVRCVSEDGKTFTSDYDSTGTRVYCESTYSVSIENYKKVQSSIIILSSDSQTDGSNKKYYIYPDSEGGLTFYINTVFYSSGNELSLYLNTNFINADYTASIILFYKTRRGTDIASAEFDAREYTFSTDLDFRNATTGYTEYNTLYNLNLKGAFISWDKLLYNETGLHLKDIGFTSYNLG